MSLTYRRVRFRDAAVPSGGSRTINAGLVSAGGVFGLWTDRREVDCLSVQVSLVGGVFSQFNLDAPSQDLINTDFVVGGQFSARRGRTSVRLRIYHQSSHLGDEFILRNGQVQRDDFGFQAIDGLLSIDGSHWRLYGGAGYLYFMGMRRSPWQLQAGAEARAGAGTGRTLRAVAAIDVTSLQARRWGATIAGSTGLEWSSLASQRRVRVMLVALDGFMPFGQFSESQRLRNVGLQLQIEH